jgi:hypothetical protein
MNSGASVVSRFRFTTVWPCVLTDLLQGSGSGGDTAVACLADSDFHQDVFDYFTRGFDTDSHKDLVDNYLRGHALPFEPPWKDKHEQKFWTDYTTSNKMAINEFSGRLASRFVVPVHYRLSDENLPNRPPWKVSCHGFLYAFGFAIVVHAYFPHPDSKLRGGGDITLQFDDLVESCYDLRTAGGEDPGFWNRLGYEHAKSLAGLYGNADAANSLGVQLTISTFLEAQLAALDGAKRNQILNALAVWPDRNEWRISKVKPSQATQVKLRNEVKGRLIHSASRGRTVWFPDGFSGPVPGGQGGLMHRRLTFLTMQTEMLARFLDDTSRRADNPSLLPAAWSDWALKASRAIGFLYGQRVKAVDSDSPKVQIDESSFKEGIEKVRGHFYPDDAALHV